MKLRNRTLLCMALVLISCCVALGIALSGMQNAKNRFIAFVDINQQVLHNATQLYAQGLQAGQAIRNIVLDPADDQAERNLESSLTSFSQILEKTRGFQEDVEGLERYVKQVAELQTKREPVLRHIARLAQTDSEAAALYLKQNDTPVWREIRSALQTMIQQETEHVQHTRDAVVDFTNRILFWSLALACVAVVLGVVIALYLTRVLMRQLGAEPADTVAITHHIAEGDLAVAIHEASRYPGSVIESIRTMQHKLARIVTQVREGAESIAMASRQIAVGNQDLSSRTEEQASSLQETAASMEQLTSTVKQSSQNARHANELAVTASGVAIQGGEVVHKVVDRMHAIHQSAAKISEIVGVIDGIAFQTNILALNAAVEAARAGEQGRGFAVVASEVRALAQRSATAAREIKVLIEGSVQQVEEGAELASQAGQTMSQVVASIQNVTQIVSEITTATHEQTTGIEQVNTAIVQMDSVTQQNAALVEQAAAASSALQEQAIELTRLMSIFRLNHQVAG